MLRLFFLEDLFSDMPLNVSNSLPCLILVQVALVMRSYYGLSTRMSSDKCRHELIFTTCRELCPAGVAAGRLLPWMAQGGSSTRRDSVGSDSTRR